jgi:HK97 gp10 family phage protein
VYDHIPAVIRVLEDQEDNLSRSFANNVRQKAKAIAPVRTGLLKLSIHVTPTGHANYSIIADTKEYGARRGYAHYVEYGTRYMHAEPFMGPAYVEAKVVSLPVIAAGLGLRITMAATRGV